MNFWEKPLEDLNRTEWEALCDGCGKCCLHKVEDEDTGNIYPTNVACRLLDRRAGRCSDYRNRFAQVPDCIRLTPAQARAVAGEIEGGGAEGRLPRGSPHGEARDGDAGFGEDVHACKTAVVGRVGGGPGSKSRTDTGSDWQRLSWFPATNTLWA